MTKPVEPTPTIYSYYSPEVRTVVRDELATLNSRGGIHDILAQNYDPGLDELHLPIMNKYERFARTEGVIGLDTFDHKYFTNGSSEGIFHLITSLLPAEPLYQFKGEYQGYEKFADSIGRSIVTVNNTAELMKRPPGILIVSNPTSRDGSRIPNVMFKEWGKVHKIVVDLAYMGMTQNPLNLDLTDDSVIAAVGSLSKPFGMYYYRVGFCYSKWPIHSLYGTRWFKNALSIKLGERVLDHFATRLQEFKDKHFEYQSEAVVAANNKFGFSSYNKDNKIKPSEVWLLGVLAREGAENYDPVDLKPFKRIDGWQDHQPTVWRFCLTPYYKAYDS